SGYIPAERSLDATPDGLRFAAAAGDHQSDGCRDENGSGHSVSPQQIASGFTARRGTWMARVRLGELPQADQASLIHAFWVLGHAHGWVREDGEDRRVSNEIDHEWNNSFAGHRQTFAYSSTGASVGVPFEGLPGFWRKAPMGTPDAPPGLGRHHDVLDPAYWTCRYTGASGDRTLAPEACAALLSGQRASGLPAPQGDVWSTLTIHVSDAGIDFSLVSDGWGGRVEMQSSRLSPSTQLPMSALFSQHVTPAVGVRACEDPVTLLRRRTFDVDWFLYSPDPSLSLSDARAHVRTLRARGVPRLATIPDARLERPLRPLVGYTSRWGMGAWTTPLSIRLEAPRRMASGETATLLALPPERYGAYRYTWTLSTRYDDGRYVTETRDDAFGVPFTMPEGAKTVLVRVRLEELDDQRRPFQSEIVQPVERLFMIRRARRLPGR
ncbi:MAG: hypothetical protein AAFQ43_13705, partial [Bacteroidota bacterium]